MDYLRTLGSAAVSTLVQKSGLNLPFSLGPKVISLDGICSLYDATKRDDSSLVSVFEYDFAQRRDIAPLAKNALRKLRTIRHPDVLKFMDVVETDTTIHIMTERVRPLEFALTSWNSKGAREKEDWLLWGIHRISVALAFINESCSSTHGLVRERSIFLSPSGEWKLGGFELLSNPKEEGAVLYSIASILPGSDGCSSPEVKKNGWSSLKESEPASADAYALGLLLNATFNPDHHPPPTATPPHPPPAPATRGNIPTTIFPLFKKLVNPNPKGRLTSKGFLEIGMADTGFFSNNPLVKVCIGLDNFALGSEGEKASLLRMLNESLSSFPSELTIHRVLPSIVSALEYGGASAATIIPLVVKIGKDVSQEEYNNVILAPVVKLFASPDRGIRMALLDNLPEFADKLDKKTVDGKIFLHLQTGFSDTVAVIREATLKAIPLLSSKLSDRTLNNDLLRFLAKLQNDPEASIRTNTCILIGRLGPTLGYNTKRKVLVPAFLRALKDPFVHARVAALMAFMATIDCFENEELATKVIPNMSFSLVDKEKLVRDQAFKAMELFIKKLETYVATLPETALNPVDRFGENAIPSGQATLVNSAAGAAGALAGWAMSSLGKRLVSSDMQTTMTVATDMNRPTSAPAAESSRLGTLRPTLLTSASVTNSAVSSPTLPNHTPSASKSKALQLGANKIPPGVAAASLAQQLSEEAAAEDGVDTNPWGNDDLIDVNADQDDWSAFESAPTPATAVLTTIAPKLAETLTPPIGWDSETWDDGPGTPSPAMVTPSLSSTMSKEEKAAEMARRKEERKQRIARMKEQKKNAAQ